MSNKNLVDRELQNITDLDFETFEIVKDILINYPHGGNVDDYDYENRELGFTFLENLRLIQLDASKKTFRVSMIGWEVASQLVNAYDKFLPIEV